MHCHFDIQVEVYKNTSLPGRCSPYQLNWSTLKYPEVLLMSRNYFFRVWFPVCRRNRSRRMRKSTWNPSVSEILQRCIFHCSHLPLWLHSCYPQSSTAFRRTDPWTGIFSLFHTYAERDTPPHVINELRPPEPLAKRSLAWLLCGMRGNVGFLWNGVSIEKCLSFPLVFLGGRTQKKNNRAQDEEE